MSCSSAGLDFTSDPTKWCPSLLAKLAHMTSISLQFMVDISIYINIYIYTCQVLKLITGGAPHCMTYIELDSMMIP